MLTWVSVRDLYLHRCCSCSNPSFTVRRAAHERRPPVPPFADIPTLSATMMDRPEWCCSCIKWTRPRGAKDACYTGLRYKVQGGNDAHAARLGSQTHYKERGEAAHYTQPLLRHVQAVSRGRGRRANSSPSSTSTNCRNVTDEGMRAVSSLPAPQVEASTVQAARGAC